MNSASPATRKAVWHGLGQELTDGATIDQWKTESGLDWEIFRSMVMYQTLDGTSMFDDKNVLFRSDNKQPLSVVSSDYHIVQPGEVLEFFRDLVSLNGFKLSAAGSLFGGKRFWATAEVGKTFNITGTDEVNGQLLLVSSADGSSSTVAKFVSTRVVCNNTLTVALGEHTKNVVKKTHSTEWDAKSVKIDLGLIDTAWETFAANMKKLADVKVTDQFAKSYFEKKFYSPNVDAEDQSTQTMKRINTLMELYKNGAGADMSYGTANGILQATTDMFTHGTRAKQDPSRRFWEGSFGKGDTIKSEVYNDMLAMTV